MFLAVLGPSSDPASKPLLIIPILSFETELRTSALVLIAKKREHLLKPLNERVATPCARVDESAPMPEGKGGTAH